MITLVTRGLGEGSTDGTLTGLLTRGMGYVESIPKIPVYPIVSGVITRGFGLQGTGTGETKYITQYIDRGTSDATPPKIVFKEHPFPTILVRRILTKDEEEVFIKIRMINDC